MNKSLFVCAAVVLLLTGSQVCSQPATIERRPSSGMELELMRRKAVRQKLELVDYQIDALTKLRNDSENDVGEKIRALARLPVEQQGAKLKELREEMAERERSQRKKIDEILLPHQRQLLSKLHTSRLENTSAIRAFATKEMSEALGITEQQKKQMQQLQAQLRDDLQQQLAKFQRQANERFLNLLTRQQQEKLKKMAQGSPE